MDINQAELVARLKTLPPLSVPLQQVLSLLNDNNSDWSTISKTMLKDPVLTGRVLQIANSSFYGLHRQVKDVEIACATLGSETLRGLVYTLILLSKFRQGGANSLIDYDLLWKHCLRVACLVKVIARKSGMHPTTAFTIGLFHCLDLIIQDYFFPEVLQARIEKLRAEQIVTHHEKIHKMIDADYWWLSAVLLDYWQFPKPIVAVFSKESAEATDKTRAVIMVSNTVLDDLDGNGNISEVSLAQVTSIFQKNGMAIIDFQDCVDESETLYREMSGWMFS